MQRENLFRKLVSTTYSKIIKICEVDLLLNNYHCFQKFDLDTKIKIQNFVEQDEYVNQAIRDKKGIKKHF